MDRQDLLVERLKKYGKSEVYPFHMPGHKRQGKGFVGEFPNPFFIDLTEIDGFDNLHHPEGILQDSMRWAAKVYGANKTYYLINGSSGGILSAVCGVVSSGGRIIIGRNCHKSAYHGIVIKNLKSSYVYPQILEKMWINGGILEEDVEEALKEYPDAEAVLIVSPTYEGIVSDIRAIAQIVHRKGIPIIVDEAHGAHFSIGRGIFPLSALDLGADIVIQSLHKTLPSLTQTAVLHVKSSYVDLERLEWYLQVFQSSSPSYVLMASIEQCIFEMTEHGKEYCERFFERLKRLRHRLLEMKVLKLLDEWAVGSWGVYGLDLSKIVVSCRETNLTGMELAELLRNEYHLEVEMYGMDYIVMITTVYDTEDGLKRLENGLMEIDRNVLKKCIKRGDFVKGNRNIKAIMTLGEAFGAQWERLPIGQCAGRISWEFIYLYPPGIPIAVPGERLSNEVVKQISEYKKIGYSVQGMEDPRAEYLRVCVE